MKNRKINILLALVFVLLVYCTVSYVTAATVVCGDYEYNVYQTSKNGFGPYAGTPFDGAAIVKKYNGSEKM